tara:strand:- start:212 stop:334 length:123 start_codon:yes stop_codon:yes gene_type:complete
MTNHYKLEGLQALRKGKMKDKVITIKVDGAAHKANGLVCC